MGFLSSFLGGLFGHTVAEAKKDIERKEAENKAWNSEFDELQRYEEELNSYLKSIDAPAIYIFDVNRIDKGISDIEIKRINDLKQQVARYISIGGDGRFIYDLSNLDDYLLKVQLLKDHDALDRQIVFANNTYLETKKLLEEEQSDLSSLTNKIKMFALTNPPAYNLIDDKELNALIGDYYFDAYTFYCGEKEVDPLKAECGIVSILTEAVSSRFFPFSNQPDLITQDELSKITDLVMSHLYTLISYPSLNSKKGRYIYYFSLLIAAEISFWKGKLAQSIVYLTTVMNEWKEAKDESFGFSTEVVASIFSLLNILGLNEYIDQYYDLYKDTLQREQSQYRQLLSKAGDANKVMSSHYRIQLSKIENRQSTNSYLSLSLVDIMDLTKTQMYDLSLEFGDVDIPCGFYRIEENTEKNTLSLYMQKSEDSEAIYGMTLLNNLSSTVEKEKAELLRLFNVA